MISDEERREVARRLRGEVGCGSSWPGMERLGVILGVEGGSGFPGRFLSRLADLIDPSDRNDELCVHCDYCDYCDLPKCSDQDGYSFKPKGYVDLLVLADKTIRTARHDMEICGDTVPAWYAVGRLEAVARNIREILEVDGEVDA